MSKSLYPFVFLISPTKTWQQCKSRMSINLARKERDHSKGYFEHSQGEPILRNLNAWRYRPKVELLLLNLHFHTHFSWKQTKAFLFWWAQVNKGTNSSWPGYLCDNPCEEYASGS